MALDPFQTLVNSCVEPNTIKSDFSVIAYSDDVIVPNQDLRNKSKQFLVCPENKDSFQIEGYPKIAIKKENKIRRQNSAAWIRALILPVKLMNNGGREVGQ